MNSKKQWLLVFWFLLFIPSFGQVSDYQFSRLDEEGGLPQNFVYSLVQDAHGFIWIGTGKGLSRYDGRKAKSFLKDQGLFENFITASFRTSSGHLLHGHYSGGVSDFNGVYHQTLVKDTLQSEVVAIGESRDGAIWCSSKSGKLIRIEKNLSSFALIFPGELRGKIINAMAVRNDDLFIATNEGLYTFIISGKELIFKDTPNEIQFDEVLSLCFSRKDSLHLWAGSASGTMLSIKTGVATSVERKYKIQPDLDASIIALVEDASGYVWAGTLEHGLLRVGFNERSEVAGVTAFSKHTGFPIESVKSILIDSNKDIWVGTLSDGLIKLYQQPFHYVDLEPQGITQIKDIQVRAGIYYLATSTGLYSYDPGKSGDHKIQLVNAFKGESLLSVLPLPDSVLWIGMASHSILQYDQRSQTKKSFAINSEFGEPFKARFIRSDERGNYWVSSFGQGVWKLNEKGEVLKHLTTQEGFIHNDIFAIYSDGKGSDWFGSLGAGLARIGADDSVHLYSQSGAFLSHDVNDITGDEKGNVWIATDGSGYFHYDGVKFTQPASQGEIQTPFIKSIEFDKNNGLWLAHRKGLSFIDLATQERRNFSQKDGLRDNLNYASELLMDGASLVINNEKGFTVADRQMASRQFPLSPVLTEVKLFFNESVTINPTDSEIKNQHYPSLDLSYDRNHLTFYFDAVDQHYSGPIYYRYRIEEIEKEWSPLTLENQVTYPSLNPGRFTLLVQASIDPDHWSSAPMIYKFTIEKPYWEKWWFYVLQTLVIFTVFAITYYLSRTKSAKSSVVSIMTFMCLFIIYESFQNWAETVFPSLHAGAPILRTLINLVFASAFYPLEKWVRKFFSSDQVS